MAEVMHPDPPSSPPSLAPAVSDSGAWRQRKRRSSIALDDLDPSSDLPCFSSDPPEPSQDDHAHGSRKRQYRGAWWGEAGDRVAGHRGEPTPSHRSRKFNRNFDSGIYMNSDSSDASLPSSSNNSDLIHVTTNDSRIRIYGFKSSGVPKPNERLADESTCTVAQVIQNCVQNDKEVVDLSSCNIASLAPRSLELLSTITRSDHLVDRSESSLRDEEYHSLEPALQLYLGNNRLTQLPSSMWSLDRLTVVSLRNNQLSHLSPAIARLKNLTELNVAGNELRYLPWELLDNLSPNGKLSRLTILPNPLQQIASLQNRAAIFKQLRSRFSANQERTVMPGQDESVDRATLTNDEQRRWTRLVAYYSAVNKPGTVIDYSLLPPLLVDTGNVDYLALDGSNPLRFSNATASRVPSLLELATNAFFRTNEHVDLDPADLPVRVNKALETVKQLRDEGDSNQCGICNRKYIINRTQWLEYWHWVPFNQAQPQKMTAVDPDEVFLPFLRRGCSWGCVP